MAKVFHSEGEFTRWWANEMEKQGGAKVTALVAGMMSPHGVPDRFLASPHWHGFVEVKKDNRQPTTAQKQFIQNCLLRHSPAIVLRYCSDMDSIRIEVPERGVGCRLRIMWQCHLDAFHPMTFMAGCAEACETAYGVYVGKQTWDDDEETDRGTF
jgi:hypothetical protein